MFVAVGVFWSCTWQNAAILAAIASLQLTEVHWLANGSFCTLISIICQSAVDISGKVIQVDAPSRYMYVYMCVCVLNVEQCLCLVEIWMSLAVDRCELNPT